LFPFPTAKVSDNDDLVPRFVDLNDLYADLGTPKEYAQLERRILNLFDWKISFPTVATFLNCFRPFVFLRDEQAANLKVLHSFGDAEALADLLSEEIDRIALLVFQGTQSNPFT
jgi:hypothetical protein